MENKHAQSIPPEVIDSAAKKFNEGHELLSPYLLQLSQEERQTLFKMGDKSLAFVEKAEELAKTNPQFCPSYFDAKGLRIDLSDAVNLRPLANRLQQIHRDVEDTMIVSGNEAITQALSFYSVVKQASHDKISGALAVFNELKKRFVLGRRTKPEAE
jgi:hypothetical protein